jgi:hypothetical protein
MPNKRKGKSRIALIKLNNTSSVNPTILKGNKISHIRGNKKNSSKARGQQRVSRINQRMMAMNVFIDFCFFMKVTKVQPN